MILYAKVHSFLIITYISQKVNSIMNFYQNLRESVDKGNDNVI